MTSTLWDQQFRKALVAARRPCNPDTGPLFCEMLRDLVMLCNQFEVTADWIVGAPLDELPLVEQIPVLHRLGMFPKMASCCNLVANNVHPTSYFTVLRMMMLLLQIKHTIYILKHSKLIKTSLSRYFLNFSSIIKKRATIVKKWRIINDMKCGCNVNNNSKQAKYMIPFGLFNKTEPMQLKTDVYTFIKINFIESNCSICQTGPMKPINQIVQSVKLDQ